MAKPEEIRATTVVILGYDPLNIPVDRRTCLLARNLFHRFDSAYSIIENFLVDAEDKFKKEAEAWAEAKGYPIENASKKKGEKA